MEKEISIFVTDLGAKELIPRIPKARKNYFLLYGVPLIIKISRYDWQFWGVGEKYINLFNSQYNNYFLILLTSEKSGWFFSKEEVNKFILTGKWHLREKDNNYKIITPLPSSNWFNSTNEFVVKSKIISQNIELTIPEEILTPDLYFEGASRKISINYYERNSEARNKCIEHYGFNCFICGFNFESHYGVLGKNFIHVHHLKPLSEINSTYRLDPISDLRPVCPNCHSIIHKKSPPYTIEEIKTILLKSIK